MYLCKSPFCNKLKKAVPLFQNIEFKTDTPLSIKSVTIFPLMGNQVAIIFVLSTKTSQCYTMQGLWDS